MRIPKGMFLRVLTAITAVGCTLALASASALASDQSAESAPHSIGEIVHETYTDEYGNIHYRFIPEEMPGFTLVTEQGERTTLLDDSSAPSCTFNFTRTFTEDLAHFAEEVHFDPVSCVQVLAEATYDNRNIPASLLERAVPPEGSESEGQSDSSSDMKASAKWRAYVAGYFNDPIPANVNRTEATLGWNASGRTDSTHKWTWLTLTGWSRTSSSVIDGQNQSTTIGKFKNTLFCNPIAATYTNHHGTTVRGYSNGTWQYTGSFTKSGDCSSLLKSGYSGQKWTL